METNPYCGREFNKNNVQEEIAFVEALKGAIKQRNLDKGGVLHADILKGGLLQNIFIGNALVNMYAKCGVLMKAYQVFEELIAHTIVSWTTLISGFCQHGFNEEALACFDQMQLEGFSPNEVTFLCVVKACGGMGAIRQGEEIHCEVERRGFLEHNTMLGTALVDMYAKSGAMSRAREVFEELSACDIVLWNVLISGYVQHGYAEEALKCYKHLKSLGFIANGRTFACLLKACGSMGAVEEGAAMHEEILQRSLVEKDVLLGAALVDMYVTFGALTRAERVFEELPIRDLSCWNVLMVAFCRFGHDIKVINCLELMRFEGIIPDEVSLSCGLRAYGGLGKHEKGEELHSELVRTGRLEKDDVLVTALIEMYVKCGAVSKAQQVLCELSIKDVVSWNALISGYCQEGLGKDALVCFEHMKRAHIPPNSATFACVLKACGILEAVEIGMRIHSELVKAGLLERVDPLGNALLDMYGKCGDFPMIQRLFDQLPVRDVFSWTSLISGYSQHRHAQEAIKIYQMMKHNGFFPDAITFSCVLHACGTIGDFKKGKEIHEEILQTSALKEDSTLFVTLLDMYVKCGMFHFAQEVFDQLPLRDIITWNVLLAGYCEHGLVDGALECFERMNCEGVTPDVASFACILKACSIAGACMKGEEIHAEMERGGLLTNSGILGSAVVDMYAKCGALSKAQEVFDNLLEHDVVSWTALVGGYAQIGRYHHVFHLLSQMRRDGIEPNTVTTLVALSACSYSCLEYEGQTLFESMSKAGMILTFEHHTCMVDLFGRMGNLWKAVSVIKRMPSSDHLPMWFSLMGSCQKWGSIELARVAFEHAVCLDNKSAALYVFMSKIYASAGMEKEAKEIGAMMEAA
ncbi:hypothetical protein KP509_39G046500 [Ceratopteris richardii]|nr:hypothetical protein KP509_39G046500 [Ceratopteris richardii]